MCRIARQYGTLPHVVARWPVHYYLAVRNELIAYWKSMAPKKD